MKNISKDLSPFEEYQMAFDDLMGGTFFNKDLDTPNSFGLRKAMLEHIDACECFTCDDERNRDG